MHTTRRGRPAPQESVLEVYWGDDRVARRSGDPPTGNRLVDATFENLRKIDRFVRDQLGRKGWDDKNGPLRARFDEGLVGNATFSVPEGMVIAGRRAGGPLQLTSYGFSPTVMAHEVAHGIDAVDSQRERSDIETRAIDESWADVIATGVDDDWIVGNEVPGGRPQEGNDYRDLARPPFTHLAQIEQPDIAAYSRLLSYAAVLIAGDLGKPAMLSIWYRAHRHLPHGTERKPGRSAKLVDMTSATLRAARELHGPGSEAVRAVRAVWARVGIAHDSRP